MRHSFSTIGLIFGFIAVGIAAFETHIIASEPPPPADGRSLKELAIDASKKILKERVLKEDAPPPPEKPFHPIRVTYMLLGLSALGLGMTSWIKKEHIRMSGGAAALGLMAICWQWVLISVCIAIVIFILANLSV